MDNRIESIIQPYVRPVVRGKAKAATEFGAKLHLSVDETGFGRIEYFFFNAYNEGFMLIINKIFAFCYRQERDSYDEAYVYYDGSVVLFYFSYDCFFC